MEAGLYQIAIRTPLTRLFTYESPVALEKGTRVRVPFRSQEKVGFVWGPAEEKPQGLKSILAPIDETPLFDPLTLDFYEQAARYYGISLGELLTTSLPKAIREGQSVPPAEIKHFVPALPPLSEAQKTIFEEIQKQKKFGAHLLFGDTGSGKTEIYLHLMESILLEGGQILFLVPEISLTPQLEMRLNERLGARVSLYHSNLKESLRLKAFSSAWSATTDVFLGARSALFLPYRNLKLIVVDEEHDTSYKQNERAPYHARDLALLKAKLFDIPIVLGSATPSIESLVRAKEQGQKIHRLKKFYEGEAIQLEVLDLKETWKAETRSFISNRLHEAIEETLGRKEQTLLFLNRRGSATQRLCVRCGHSDSCPHCSSGLTFHFDWKQAICHLCGYRAPLLSTCSSCGSEDFFIGGVGTKEVEEQIKLRFPQARVERLDRDQMTNKGVLPKIMDAFSKGKIDILIGTQMISKGIDIPGLSLVGLVLADQGWNVPDFRAMEKSLQLLLQVLGRGGRRGQAALGLIQTFEPKHPLFDWLKSERPYEAWIEDEIQLRQSIGLPPFLRDLLWTFSHKDRGFLEQAAQAFAERIEKAATVLGVQLFAPVPSPLYKIKSLFRMQVLARSKNRGALTSLIQTVNQDLERRPLGVRVRVDRDPYHYL